MKLAVITDIHAGQKQQSTSNVGLIRKAAQQAIPRLKQIIPKINLHQPHLAFNLGDINQKDDEASISQDAAEAVLSQLAEIRCPLINLIGNHELSTLGSVDYQQRARSHELKFDLFGRIDIGGFQLVWLDMIMDENNQYLLTQERLNQLDTFLQTKQPTIIFSHVPFVGFDTRGNYYWNDSSRNFGYANQAEILDCIQSHQSVKVCINGHNHWLAYQQKAGIHFVTLPSFTENIAGMDYPTNHPGIYTMINLQQQSLCLKVWSGGFVFSTIALDWEIW